MEARFVDTILCPNCEATLPAAAALCPHCGATTRPGHLQSAKDGAAHPAAGARPAAARAPQGPPLLDRPWVVLSLLFFVMAILGLPLLWKSRAFSLASKVLLSIIVTLYTLALFAGVGAICVWAYRRVVDAM